MDNIREYGTIELDDEKSRKTFFGNLDNRGDRRT